MKGGKANALVNRKRLRPIKEGKQQGQGPVVYWMSRDQRVADNWALLYAAEQAAEHGAPVAVVFNLVPAYLGAGARHFGFMLRGLRETAEACAAKGIAFFLLRGEPKNTIPQFVADTKAGLLVTDYSPLRLGREWRQEVSDKLPADVPFMEVDAHNVVPVWEASDKRETGARTIRPKIHKALPEFLREFPPLPVVAPWAGAIARKPHNMPSGAADLDWDATINEALQRGAAVPEVHWIKPGAAAAMEALQGPDGFLTPKRLKHYTDKRNDPAAKALSNLSPYIHYGQLSAQRIALQASTHRAKFKEAVDGFLEELVVRRELSDNFCEHVPNYDSLDCAAQWAKDSLNLHRSDKREHIYTRDQLEEGKTHDDLWNASQLEMVHLGKMHGFMRMYWAKKILEWTRGPEDAIAYAIYLNDKFELDGRDPNGYVGVMWSMAGIHDMGWAERSVFGKIRYMNYAGCKRKFNIDAYISCVAKARREEEAARKQAGGAGAAAAVGAKRPAAAGDEAGPSKKAK